MDSIDIIQGLTTLKLSAWGKIQLLRFTPEALLHAASFNGLPGINDAITHFCKVATAYSNSNSLPIDYAKVDHLRELYQIPKDTPSTLEEDLLPVDTEAQPTYQTTYEPPKFDYNPTVSLRHERILKAAQIVGLDENLTLEQKRVALNNLSQQQREQLKRRL